ncbi:hypothetical protein SFC79_03900 [Nocardioides sp. S-58]|uniref:PPE family protein n=1 Tax=Nocardioides renjunii TaxID=3095075 RepID=A0ABU5K7L2_9ACTN|nr:hypothetical protein [Nocardioides sp. S-58]MDZ5660896.1 hypothetical protein [Nocardioides sp. S-58]
MPANPWELRADVRPLEVAATRWDELSTLMTRRGDEIVDAARRATEGWDASAAESYELHRRQVLVNLDRFTALADQVSGALRAVSTILTSFQKELDQAWVKVAMVPHEVVGESRHLVFHPSADDERGTVTLGQQETEEIRGRMALALDQESARLRAARAELVDVRIVLETLGGSAFPGMPGPGQEESGVGMVAPPSTTVVGAAQGGVAGGAGVAGLPPVAPISVSVPDLTGLSAAALGTVAATAAGAVAGRRGASRAPSGTPPIGAMGAGAMAARAGTMSRGMASGRSGPHRLATPQLERTPAEDAAARAAREKEAVREAKRAALEEKRAERAARRAERRAERESERERRDGEQEPVDEHEDEHEDGQDDAVDEGAQAPASAEGGGPADLRVVEVSVEDLAADTDAADTEDRR